MGKKNRQDGTAMVDDKGRNGQSTAPRVKDSRQDRLKSALRENLKRRKTQARERAVKNDTAASDDGASPDGELGKRAD
jgi:hypothetical protein